MCHKTRLENLHTYTQEIVGMLESTPSHLKNPHNPIKSHIHTPTTLLGGEETFVFLLILPLSFHSLIYPQTCSRRSRFANAWVTEKKKKTVLIPDRPSSKKVTLNPDVRLLTLSSHLTNST